MLKCRGCISFKEILTKFWDYSCLHCLNRPCAARISCTAALKRPLVILNTLNVSTHLPRKRCQCGPNCLPGQEQSGSIQKVRSGFVFRWKKKKDLLPLRSHDSLSKSWCVFFVESEPVVAEPVHNGTLEKVPEVTTANPVPPTDWEVTVSSVTTAAAGEIFIYLCETSSTPKNK